MSLQDCFTFFLLTFVYGTCEEDFIHQQPLVVAELGSSVTLPCFHSDDFITTISWYKHSAGKKPLLIAHSAPNSGRVTYQNAFNNTNRFFITIASGSYNLSILHLEKEDFATYYCAKFFLNIMMFGEGTILLHNETNRNISTSVSAPSLWSPVVCILLIISVISIVMNIVLVIQKSRKKETTEQLRSQINQIETDDLNYAALHFSKTKPTTSRRSSMKTIQETIYSETTVH
nr:novel immune-type receptor 3d, allele 7 [Danio rerio]